MAFNPTHITDDKHLLQRLAAQICSRVLSSFRSSGYILSSQALEETMSKDKMLQAAVTIANDISSILDSIWQQEKLIQKLHLERITHSWMYQELLLHTFPVNSSVTVMQANYRVKFPALPRFDLQLYITIVNHLSWEFLLSECLNVVDQAFTNQFLRTVITAFQDSNFLNVNHFICKLFQLTLQEWKRMSIKHDLLLMIRNFSVWIQIVSSLENHSFNDNVRNDVLELVMDYYIILINLWLQQNKNYEFADSSSIKGVVTIKDRVADFMISSLSVNLKSKGFQEDLKDLNDLGTKWQSVSCNFYHDKNVLLQDAESNISYSSPNCKYIYFVAPDDVVTFQQIKLTLVFAFTVCKKALQNLNSHSDEDTHMIQDKALCILLFNKWLFNESTIPTDPEMEEIMNNKLSVLRETFPSKSDVIKFIQSRNFLNKNISQEKVANDMDDMSLEHYLNEVEKNTSYTSDSISWLLDNSLKWSNNENFKLRILRCFLQHLVHFGSVSNFMRLFNVGLRSNIASDDYNADTNLNFRSLYRQLLLEAYQQLSLFEQSEVQISVLKNAEISDSVLADNDDWLEGELIKLLNRVAVSKNINKDANRNVYSALSFLALISPYSVIYQIVLAAVQQVNKTNLLIEFLYSVSTICRFRSIDRRLSVICNAVYNCGYQVKNDTQIKCYLRLVTVILDNKSLNITVQNEPVPVIQKSLIRVDKLSNLVILPCLHRHDCNGMDVTTVLKLLHVAINYFEHNIDTLWMSPILPILKRLCELLDNVRLIRDSNDAKICTLTTTAISKLARILKATILTMENESGMLINSVTWLFENIKYLDWQVGLYLEALFEYTDYRQKIPVSVFKICNISNNINPFETFRSFPYDEEPFVGFFQCCMPTDTLQEFFTTTIDRDIALRVQDKEAKVIHALALVLPNCDEDEYQRTISALVVLLEKNIITIFNEATCNVKNKKIQKNLTLSVIVVQVFDKILKFYREELINDYCLSCVVKLYVRWMKKLCDIHLDESDTEGSQANQMNYLLQHLFSDVAYVTVLLPEWYQELSLSLLLDIITLIESYSRKVENLSSLEFIDKAIQKLDLCDGRNSVIKQRLASAFDNVNVTVE